jgi:hypothetical protein
MDGDIYGNVYVAAAIRDIEIAYLHNSVILKYSEAGNKSSFLRYTDPLVLSSSPNAVKITATNAIVFTGRASKRDYPQSDMLTVKYSQPIGIKQVSSEIPKQYTLYQNYPNPFNPSTFITLDVPRAQNVKIIIYDVTGRQVMVLLEKELKPGKYTIDFDGSALCSGVYFYTLDTPDFMQTKKMVLLK